MRDRFNHEILVGDEIVYAVKKSTWVDLKLSDVLEASPDSIRCKSKGWRDNDITVTLKTPSNVVNLSAYARNRGMQ
jgi:hypothetical protein